MNIRLKAGGLTAVVAMLALAACDSPSELGSADAEGRMRLSADNSYGEFGDYVIHINGLPTATLTPEIAQNYGITRSESSGLVNLVVLKNSGEPGLQQPVRAQVTLKAANLTGQVKPVEMREITEGPSIYYIGVVSVDNRETVNFDFDIVPEGSNRNLPVRFTHKFYSD